jgi:hypothetical protein
MKTLRYFIFPFNILIFSLLISCQKTNDPQPFTERKPLCKILNIRQDGVLSSEVSYGSKGKVEKMISYGKDKIISTMVYNTQNQLIRKDDRFDDGSLFGYKLYEYNPNGTLALIKHYLPNLYDYQLIEFHHQEVLEYNAQNQLIKLTYYHLHNQSHLLADNAREFEYNAQGNLSQVKIYSHGISSNDLLLAAVGRFVYDNQPNPLPLYGFLPTLAEELGANNILKATYTYPDGTLWLEGCYEASYEYDSHNFPIRMKQTFVGKTTVQKDFTFVCSNE